MPAGLFFDEYKDRPKEQWPEYAALNFQGLQLNFTKSSTTY